MNRKVGGAGSNDRRSGTRQKIWGLAGLSLAIFLMVAATNSAAKETTSEDEPRFQITVRVYNYAGVTGETLLKAEEEGTRIFRKVEVGSAWIDCGSPQLPKSQASPCQIPLGAITVNMRILPPAMAARFESSREEMGFALVSGRAGGATDAWVFYQRVKDAAASDLASASQILAYAMAHEIGHLLLGPDHHTHEGIMCARWNLKALEEIGQGQMLFTRGQANLIRNELQTRNELAREIMTGRPAPREVAAIKGK